MLLLKKVVSSTIDSPENRGNVLDRVIVGISQFVPSIPYYILALLFYLVGLQ